MIVPNRYVARTEKRLAFSVLSLLFVVFCSNPAPALEIDIRAHSQIQAGVTAAGTMVRVNGALQDRVGNGMPQRAIDVRFSKLPAESSSNLATVHSERVFTGRGGVFRLHRELSPGRWRVDIKFEETPHLSGDHFSQTLEVRPAPVSLSVQVPSFINGAVGVEADSQEPGGQIPVRIQATVEGVGLPEAALVFRDGVAVGSVELDPFGRGSLFLTERIEPGFHDLRVELSAPRYQSARPATAKLRISGAVEIDAKLHEVVERLRRGLAVEGEVRDQLGAIPNARISVRLSRRDEVPGAENDQSQQLHRVLRTDETGHFSAFFPSGDLPDGLWLAEVEAVPKVGPRVLVSVDPLKLDRTISRWLLNFLGILGLLGGFGLLVQRFWQVIYTYWSERRREKASRERVEAALSDVEELGITALDDALEDEAVASKKVTYLSGVVWDVWKQRPIQDAELIISTPDGTEISTQKVQPETGRRAGAFRIDELAAGRYHLEVRAPGFMPAGLDFRLPHQGSLSNMRLDLVAIPLKIRRLYQSLVETLDGHDLWGRLSPRQIEDALQSALQADALIDAPEGGQYPDTAARRAFVAALQRRLREPESADGALDIDVKSGGGEHLLALMTAVVEETYFSGRTFDMAVWTLARDIAEKLRDKAEESR